MGDYDRVENQGLGFGIGVVVALATHPLDDVISALAQVHLLGRGPGPLKFWSVGVARGGALMDTLGRLL